MTDTDEVVREFPVRHGVEETPGPLPLELEQILDPPPEGPPAVRRAGDDRLEDPSIDALLSCGLGPDDPVLARAGRSSDPEIRGRLALARQDPPEPPSVRGSGWPTEGEDPGPTLEEPPVPSRRPRRGAEVPGSWIVWGPGSRPGVSVVRPGR